MTIYDAAMIGVVIAGMVWGALRGITWQLASIASLVLGYSVAYPLSGQLAHRFPGEPVVARALAMLAVYISVSGGIFLAAWIVRTTLQRWKFDAFDRHLGMILGGLEGALLGVVATLFVVSLAPRTRETILTSPTGTAVNHLMTALGPILPGEIRDVLSPFDHPSDPLAATVEPVEARPSSRTRRAPDANPEPATLEDFYEEGRSRVGRAVIDTAEQELRRARTRGDRTAGASDEEIEPGTLNELYKESRSRVGRAILDSAEQELQRARGANDRTVKRR
jgi:membrane protein required for colicin V production